MYKLTLTPQHSIEKYKYFTLGEVGEGVGQLRVGEGVGQLRVGEGVGQLRVGEGVGQLRVGVEELKKLFGVIWGWQNKLPNYTDSSSCHGSSCIT